jgi:hypothetical protein
VLVQPGERQPCLQESGHDVAQRVQPLIGSAGLERGPFDGIVVHFVDDNGAAFEIWDEAAGHPVRRRDAVVEHEGRRMAFRQVEETPGLQEMGDDLGPSPDIGKPAQCAPRDEDDIERGRFRNGRRGVIEICFDELRPIR